MKTIFTFLFSCLAIITIAQTTFVSKVDADGYSIFNQCVQLADGSYIAAGFFADRQTHYNPLLLVQMDGVGRVIKSKSVLGDQTSFSITALIKTKDGGFAVLGILQDGGIIIKFQSDLTVEWKKKLTFNDGSRCYTTSLTETPEGNYAIAGNYYNLAHYTNAVYIATLNAQGDLLSGNTYMLDGSEGNFRRMIGISGTGDGNYAFMVEYSSMGSADSCAVYKVAPAGEVLWRKAIFIGNKFRPVGILCTRNNIVVSGASIYTSQVNGNLSATYKIWVARFNNDGTKEWIKEAGYPSNYSVMPSAMTIDSQGHYIVGTSIYVFTSGAQRPLSGIGYLGFNSDGSLAWEKETELTTSPGFNPYCLAAANDNGVIAAGMDINPQNYSYSATLHKYDETMQSCDDALTQGNVTVIDTGTIESLDKGVSGAIALTVSETYVTISDIGDFSYPCNSILPVKLLSFTATAEKNGVSIVWKTANEINAGSFAVERSSDGRTFSTVQSVSAKGSANGTADYGLTDHQPLPGTSYYRLQQVDKDGGIIYTSVVPVVRSNGNSVAIYPNPVKNTIHLFMQSMITGKVQIQVSDVTGKIIMTQSFAGVTGNRTIDIPASGLGKGMYLVKVTEGNRAETIKVIKE